MTSSAPADPRAGPGRLAGTPERRRRVETLDWLAEPHLAAWRRGLLEDDSLRRKLAELIAESDVPSAVAHRVCAFNGRGFDARLHADLTEKLRTLLVDKMLPPSTTFDPRKASSIRGWAWNLASTAAVYQRRDLRRFYERFQLLASSDLATVSSDRGMASMTGAAPLPTDPGAWDLDTCADVADAVQTLAKPDRQLVHLQAEALLTGLGLPSLQRIPQLADRERVTNLLEDDPTLALRSLNVWLAAATLNRTTGHDAWPAHQEPPPVQTVPGASPHRPAHPSMSLRQPANLSTRACCHCGTSSTPSRRAGWSPAPARGLAGGRWRTRSRWLRPVRCPVPR